MNKLILLLCCSCLFTTACKAKDPAMAAIDADYNAGKPVKVTTAPDGTTLWRVWDRDGSGKEIFFSSRGTYHTTSELQGKMLITKEHGVPNAE